MGAVDVGVGHDDHAPVAQILVAVFRPGATPSARSRSTSSSFCASFCFTSDATFRILPRNGNIACDARSRAFWRTRPPIAFDDENLGAFAPLLVQSASFPGSRSFRVALLRALSFSPGGAAAAPPAR